MVRDHTGCVTHNGMINTSEKYIQHKIGMFLGLYLFIWFHMDFYWFLDPTANIVGHFYPIDFYTSSGHVILANFAREHCICWHFIDIYIYCYGINTISVIFEYLYFVWLDSYLIMNKLWTFFTMCLKVVRATPHIKSQGRLAIQLVWRCTTGGTRPHIFVLLGLHIL